MRLPTVLGLILLLPLTVKPESGDAGPTGAGRKDVRETIPAKRAILAALREVNSYQLAHPVPDAAEDAEPLSHLWPRVTWHIGVVAAWEATGDPSFLDQCLAYGRELHWQVGKDPNGPNRLFPIQLWAELYLAKSDRAMIEPSIQWLATPSPLTPAGPKVWYLDAQNADSPPVPYVDSLFGAPALAMLAKITGNAGYRAAMDAFFDGVTSPLFDRESGLYYRDPNFIGRKTKNGRKILWSRGNGWAFAGIPRVLNYLPAQDPDRERYLAIFRRMAPELVKRQGADGLWRMNLDDPDQFPNPETSGTGFFCFGLAWGINHGVLSRREYLPAVERAWAGLVRSLSPEGRILWGQQEDAEPNAIERDRTPEFVAGTFMLAGSEVYTLAP